MGGDTAWGAYHSLYDTIGWQEIVDSDWMLAEDIARFTGVLTLKLLDEIVLPFDLRMFAVTMKEWFTNNLMNAMDAYDCNPDDILNEDVTEMMLDAIEEFEDAAIELNEILLELRNKTSDSSDSIDSNESESSDSELITEFNALLSGISKEFLYFEGLPERTWHKNILWNTAIEDGPNNVFPYIWYALQYECEETMLRQSFEITQLIIDGATQTLQMVLGNVTTY